MFGAWWDGHCKRDKQGINCHFLKLIKLFEIIQGEGVTKEQNP